MFSGGEMRGQKKCSYDVGEDMRLGGILALPLFLVDESGLVREVGARTGEAAGEGDEWGCGEKVPQREKADCCSYCHGGVFWWDVGEDPEVVRRLLAEEDPGW